MNRPLKDNKVIRVLGIRGIPAVYGGFETFAEHLSLYLVNHGWCVTVYCQENKGNTVWESEWKGVRLIHIPVRWDGALGTIVFDWKSILHASKRNKLVLTLGYNTAVFCLIYRFKGIINLFNMDGLEWRRDKWGILERIWLYMNERIACRIGNHLIADHPEIKNHLLMRVKQTKITMIPYGADSIDQADETSLDAFGLTKRNFSVVICRPEPENSIREIVEAFSCKVRNHKLVILGDFFPDKNEYHKSVLDAASGEVVFPGATYDMVLVKALRFYCRIYIHGHTVGGTNPSLVEAMGAGAAVLAHDNSFNRWVASDGAVYFKDVRECRSRIDQLLRDEDLIEILQVNSRMRHTSMFDLENVMAQYKALLLAN